MFTIIFNIFLVQAAFLSQNDNQILTRFIDAFGKENLIDIWIKDTQRTGLCEPELFKGIISKIKDVIYVINTKEFTTLKSLILSTNMNLSDAGYPFYETINILNSVKRILEINKEQNFFKTYDMSYFNKGILYKEYKNIHDNLATTILCVGLEGNTDATIDGFKDYDKSENLRKYIPENIKRNLSATINLMRISNDMLESLLSKKKNEPVYVESCFEGLNCNRKCCGSEVQIFSEDKSILVLPYDSVNYRVECLKRGSTIEINRVKLKKYIGKTYGCNKTMTKILIMLFHYYSEIKGKNTSYEICLNGDNLYHIKWSFSNLSSLQAIKQYWWNKDIQGYNRTKKKIHKFGLIVDYDVEYSTEKSKDTEDNPIKTRLFVLECGHQLGFELIDEYLEKIYIRNPLSPKCHVCRGNGVIIGSYDTIVYKYKSNPSLPEDLQS